MPPAVPFNHYGSSRNQQNRDARPILLFHANIFGPMACFEHSNFFKVIVLVPDHPKAAVHQEGSLGPSSTCNEADPASETKLQLRAF